MKKIVYLSAIVFTGDMDKISARDYAQLDQRFGKPQSYRDYNGNFPGFMVEEATDAITRIILEVVKVYGWLGGFVEHMGIQVYYTDVSESGAVWMTPTVVHGVTYNIKDYMPKKETK